MMSGIFLAWWYMRTPGHLKVFHEASTSDDWYIEAIAQEFFGGVILVLVHLLTTNPLTTITRNMLWHTALISFTYVSLFWWSILRTGGSLNPAYGLAQTFISMLDTGDGREMKFVWIYVLAPIIGGVVSWVLYEFVYVKAYELTSENLPVSKGNKV